MVTNTNNNKLIRGANIRYDENGNIWLENDKDPKLNITIKNIHYSDLCDYPIKKNSNYAGIIIWTLGNYNSTKHKI